MDRPVASRLYAFTLSLTSLVAVPALAADSGAVVEMIAQAEQKQSQAREQEHAWSVTNDYIEEARRQLDDGNVEAASKAAARALKSANVSLEQAAVEADAWRARVPGS